MKLILKPVSGEYPPYTSMYIDLLPDDGLVLQHLEENLKKMQYFILSLPENKLDFRYAIDKWTIKEILVHIIDDERIYSYRALRFARNDKTELPGFEQDDYAVYSSANNRTIESILEEYESVRRSTLSLFKNLPDEAFLRSGTANNNPVTVRALIYHIAGHELHHMNIIKRNYFNSAG
jgi:uncharacterized damage-inducible protein DinB